MNRIDFLPGTNIDRAAAVLVASAPACADFNGIPIRAQYATTKPRDIVARFTRLCDERAVRYRESPTGKRERAETERRRAAAQATVDSLVRGLSETLESGDVSAVLTWVEAIAEPADFVGVDVPADVASAFVAAGWAVNANRGEAFDGTDARNFAGWIVGQWLASRMPLAGRFVADWRAKFGAVAS